jgi:hypothetical protein
MRQQPQTPVKINVSMEWRQVVNQNIWAYLVLTSGTLLAWLPLLGRSLPVADDFPLMSLIQSGGLLGYVRSLGFWRPLGQYLPIYLFLKNPLYHPLLVVCTHLLAVLLLFNVCQSLFGGIRLPLVASLIFATFPFGYEALTWVITYNYLLPVPLFLTALLLLVDQHKWRCPSVALFCVISILALFTVLANESLLFVTALSGGFVWLEQRSDSFPTFDRRRLLLASAPSFGCVMWLILFYAFKGADIPKHVTNIHIPTLLSVYYRQYSLFDVFLPLLSPVTRGFVIHDWSNKTLGAVFICAVVFLFGIVRVSRANTIFRPTVGMRMLFWIIALLFGASLIYVLAGGFSLDSRKKYPLVVLLLLFGCWIVRTVFKRRQMRRLLFIVTAIATCGMGAITTWLIVGIWKYQTARYNDLADFLVARHISRPIEIRWNPDLYTAWPQMVRSVGYRFDDIWVMDLALEYRGGADLMIPAGQMKTVQYDAAAQTWFLSTQ